MKKKFIFLLFILPVLLFWKTETYQAQTVIREKVELKPSTKEKTIKKTTQEYSPLVITLLGARPYSYTISGPGGSISGSDGGSNIINENIDAVNGDYLITVSSSCECNTSVGVSVT